MGTREILWRIRTVFANQLDAVRMPLGRYPRLSSTIQARTDQNERGLNFSLFSESADWNAKDDSVIGWSIDLCEKADLAMQDRLDYFDLEEQFLGAPIDWQRDWSSGKSGLERLSTRIDYRDFSDVGDCKLVWEPNRHHQLVVLARAYKVTNKSSYAEKVVELMLDWIESNPVGYGMNWKSPLELGIRLINWACAIDLIRDAGVIDDRSWRRIVESIYVMEWDVQRKFSEGSSANNHLIGEAAGVYIATSYFPHLPASSKWNEKSKKILEEEILRQTFIDGCTKEHAFGYQFFVLQFFSLSALVGRKLGKNFSAAYLARLHQMYNFMAEICADTGRQPNMGDADDGYVLDLGELPNQPAELLAVGAHLFDDEDLVSSSPSETVFWLFGKSKSERSIGLPDRDSRAFPESGYFILRSESTHAKTCNRLSAFFDCAELGYGSIAAHGHADCLSFTLNVGRFEFLVDSGTYDYFSYPEWRSYFRTTRAHNTVTVDDCCQSVSQGAFLWGARAKAHLLKWRDDPTIVEVTGQHDGYCRLSDPVIHTRSLRLDKTSRSLLVKDDFKCQSEHRFRQYFHLAPECSVEQTGDLSVRISRSGISIILRIDRGTLEVINADNNVDLGWISRAYHSKAPSNTIVITNDLSAGGALLTKIDSALSA